MSIVRIFDTENGTLSFDLRHILLLLKPGSLQARWVVTSVKSSDGLHEWFDATGDGGKKLELLATVNACLSGVELGTLAKATRQVIWGEFIATLPTSQEPWVIVRGVDSTYFEVVTSDQNVLKAVKSSFRDVRSDVDPI